MKSPKNHRLLLLLLILLLCWSCGGVNGMKPKVSGNTELFTGQSPGEILRTAENRFKAGKYAEAISAYDAFEKYYPASKLLPYCIFGRGLCYFEQRETFDRDQTANRKAAEQFQRLKEKYPGWRYTAQAEANLKKCRSDLAEHEFYVGSFYQRTGRHKAALARYQGLVQDYPDFPKIAEAKKGIAACETELTKPRQPKGFLASLFDARW